MNAADGLTALLLALAGLATITVGVWAAFTHQPWVAAGSAIVLLAFTTAIQRLATHTGDPAHASPWSANEPDEHGPATVHPLIRKETDE